MNYKKHYNILCERAKNRKLTCYAEKHHIIPKCLKGSNEKSNIIELTAEEHYVAHQLLVKMYPGHKGLIWAALQMTGQPNGKRNNNKIYGWLRRKYQKISKQRTGTKNGSYGRRWYYNPNTLENIKCYPEEVPRDYIKGRKISKNRYNNCLICGESTKSYRAKYCKEHRNEMRLKGSKKGLAKARVSERVGGRKHDDATIHKELRHNNGNIEQTLKRLNYKISRGGNTWKRVEKIKRSMV